MITALDIPSQLVAFLVKKKALKKYLDVVNSSSRNTMETIHLIRQRDYCMLIRLPFVKTDTPQGYDYWNKMSDQWEKVCAETFSKK